MRKLLGILCLASGCWAAGASPSHVRDSAAKALAVLQSSQKGWYAKQSCSSCHHQVLPALAFRAAREHGIAVDEGIARADAARTFAPFANIDRAVQYTHVIDAAMDDGYRLLAADATGVRPSVVTAVYARLIAMRQKPDGRWVTGDARPPQSYSTVTATAVGLRAIQLYSHASLAGDTKARIQRAGAWLASSSPRDTEERTYQLLGLWWAGADRASLKKLSADLMATQQRDGGWNARTGLPSDAYSTGQVLVALHDAGGVSDSDPNWHRGIEFLVTSQAPDGSWHVTSRLQPPAPVSPPYFESGIPYGHDQFISAMGTAWAVMALARALPPVGKVDAPAVREAEPVGVEPWVETVLFGTAAEVRALLDQKFDPDSSTKSGGTTALMLAMPDLQKTKLLLDRGAKVNLLAKTKYSALMVAAQYPNATPVMNLLLDRGADVRPPKGAGAPVFNASPLVLAALAGNAEVLPRLRDAGNDPNARMMVLGLFPISPLIGAAGFDDVAVTRALLDCGAAVDSADDDDITPLGWAVIPNHPEVAQVLIERGAKVNHVDKKGMTPLLYAASIDFGGTAMIDLLLKAGADPSIRNKEGLTAADLVRKYKHTHLLKGALRDTLSPAP